ncbi:MAG: TolC family protein [Acidobacteria bacterium]|nr:TolC family protein [Acidobacteriota bacterium]
MTIHSARFRFDARRPRAGVRLVLIAGALLAAAPPLGAQDRSDEQRLDEIARVAAQRFLAARAEEEQTRPTVPAPPPGQMVDLTLEDAVTRALERNLELAVERLNPQTFDLTIARLRSAYNPVATSQFNQRAVVLPPTNQLNGGNIVQNDTTDYNAGILQALPWGGGAVSFQFNNRKQVTSNIFANFNPTFTSNFNLVMTQPLLRGLLVDNNRQQLRVTTINREISEIQLRGTVATTMAAVRNAYWELLYALDAVEVARGSLTLAEKLVEDNRARVEIGTMAPLDVVQAEAEAATRRQALAQAEATWRTAELALKRLIVSGTDDPLWRASLRPIDPPSYAPEPLDVEGAVRRALEDRTDLAQARRQIDANNLTLRFMRNEMLPDLELAASYGAQGLGGTQFIRQGSGLGSSVIGSIPGGYADALRTLSGVRYPTWNLQLNLSYPLGTSGAEANYARARIQLSQSTAQLRALELQVATDVTNAALQAENSITRYEAALAARQLAETRLEAEQSRFEVGLSTNFFVVQAQRDLATAQSSELRALLDYRRALVDYQRLQEAPSARGGGIGALNAGGADGGAGGGFGGGAGAAAGGFDAGGFGAGGFGGGGRN